METLFNMDETFQKERPTKITKKQREEIYDSIAQKIVDNGWAEDIHGAVEELKQVNFNDNGYEIAKKLENECGWSIDVEMVDFLDCLASVERDIKDKNIDEWVKCTKPVLKYPIGTKLNIVSVFTRSYKVGDIVYVNAIYDKSAQYGISLTNDSKTNTMIDFEVLELNTTEID